MHIVIVGPGALGCLLTAILNKGGEPADTISLLDYSTDRAEQINCLGITYQNDAAKMVIPVKVYSDPVLLKPADVVFLCVKSYDVSRSINFCAPLLNTGALLIFMQNGIAHLPFNGKTGDAATVFATTTEGATNLGGGHVRHAGAGETYLGFLDKPKNQHRELLADLVTRLQKGGTQASVSDEILNRIWQKLVINVGINALTVIHNCRNGELASNSEALLQMHLALEETRKVAKAKNISITSTLDDIVAVCRATAQNISSMLQDVQRRRRTEIDAINGAVVEAAASHGFEAPMNFKLVQQVKEIEAKY